MWSRGARATVLWRGEEGGNWCSLGIDLTSFVRKVDDDDEDDNEDDDGGDGFADGGSDDNGGATGGGDDDEHDGGGDGFADGCDNAEDEYDGDYNNECEMMLTVV